MPSQGKMDDLYMDIASRIAQMSHAVRLKVGAVIVKGENIISMGWNGTPKGESNECEIHNPDGTLTTKPNVIHAEKNAVRKLIEANTDGQLNGATFYATHSPCPACTHMIRDSKIARVVYAEQYRDSTGIEELRSHGIQVDRWER